MMSNRVNRSALAGVLYLFFGIQASFAAVNLSVNPIDGSNSLRFEQKEFSGLESKKQVRVRVTSTDGKKYQVFQRVLDPIVNEKGQVLNVQAIESQTLANSNTAGTLYAQNPSPLGMGEELIYSSGQGGESDFFVVGYDLRPELLDAGGNLTGKIVYTARAVGEGSGDRAVLNVYVDGSTGLQISVKGSRNPTRVEISDNEGSLKSADVVAIDLSGNASGEMQVYQEMETIPQNEKGVALKAELLSVFLDGNTPGLRAPDEQQAGQRRVLVYSSNAAEDHFTVQFSLDPELIQEQDAGVYRGRIKYTVETAHAREEFLITLQCAVRPIFTMDVKTPSEGVSFSHVLATEPAQEKQVTVTVRSNLHAPYQVMQYLPSGLSNERGTEFSKDHFTLKVDVPSGQKGQTKFVEHTAVETGEYPVFSSDGQGSSATFNVVYRLQGYDQMNAGNFTAPVRFSLNQQ